MTDFDDVFNGNIAVTDDEKTQLARHWLKSEYNIEVKEDQVLAAILDVHLHNSDAPQHFAHPLIDSTYGESIVQIVFATGNWHLSYRKEGKEDFTLVHPKSEGKSWKNIQNRSAALEIGLILKNGVLGEVREPVRVVSTPSAFIDGSNVQLVIPEETVKDPTIGSGSIDILSGLGSTSYGSVTIDLGTFGEPEKKD